MKYTYRIMEFKFIRFEDKHINVYRYEVELLDSVDNIEIMSFNDFEHWCCRWYRHNTIFTDNY